MKTVMKTATPGPTFKEPHKLTPIREHGPKFDFVSVPKKRETKVFSTGATRKPIKEAYHLVCPELERRVSLICAEGLEAYAWKESGDSELTTAAKGMPKANLIKHLDGHWKKYKRGDRSEDNLAKVAWAIQQLMHQETFEGSNPDAPNQCDHYKILDEFNKLEGIH